MKRAAIYVRVSRSTEESVSIDRQETELRALAEAESWPVVAVFTDDGLSGRVERAKADAALAMLAGGEAEVLLVWELSRWSRMGLSAVSKLVTVLDEHEGTIFLAKKEGLRSDQPMFRLLAVMIAEMARAEAESTRDRILSMRSHVLSQTDSEQQRWLGGQPPFGYLVTDRSGGPGRALALDPYEVGYAKEAARRLAAGERLTDVTKWLQDESVPTPQSAKRRARQAGKPLDGLDGGAWRITTVRTLFLSPTLLGRTTKKVQVGTRSDGSPIEEYRVVTDSHGMPIDRWEPVIDAGTFAAIQARLTKRGPNEPRKAASWLSGFLYCGLCGGPLYVNSRKDRPSGSFRCATKAFPDRQCSGVSISRAGVEDYVEGVVLGMIGGLHEYRVTERIEGADGGELDSVAQAIADVQTALAQDGADYPVLIARLDDLKERRRQLQAMPGHVVKTREPTGRLLADVWREGSVQEKQFVLGDMLDSITVQKASSNRGNVADRLEEIWMDPVTEADYL